MSQRSPREFIKAALIFLAGLGLASGMLSACAFDRTAPGSALQQHVASSSRVLQFQRSIYGGITQFGLGNIDRLVGAQEFALQAPTALSARGNELFIFDNVSRILYKYDLLQEAISEFFSDAALFNYNLTTSRMTSIHVANDLSLFVADPNNARVLRFNNLGQLITTYSDPLNLSRPNTVILNERNGWVYVADSVYGHIVVFGNTGMPILAINSGAAGTGSFKMVKDMAFGPDGLYVLDLLSKEVFVMSEDGAPRYAFEAEGLVNPSAIAVDNFNRVFISDLQDNTIKVFENGMLSMVYGGPGSGAGQFYDITDLALDGNLLYVADSLNGRVQVYTVEPPRREVQQPAVDN